MRTSWLSPDLILLAQPAASRGPLVSLAARAIAGSIGADAAALEKMFGEALAGEGFSIGRGVAIPHIDLPNAARTVVCVVTTRAPVALPTIDATPPDVFLFVVARPDPKAHLLLLAHLARLAQSRTFVDGLRAARDSDEVVALVEAAEQRISVGTPFAAAPSARVLVVLVASGESLVDAILMDLVDRGFEDGCILEAQSLREAATNEVPLFAGFRDIFGDPGGRRVILVEASSDQAEVIAGRVRRLCEDHRAPDVRLYVLPIHMQWRTAEPAAPEAPEGH